MSKKNKDLLKIVKIHSDKKEDKECKNCKGCKCSDKKKSFNNILVNSADNKIGKISNKLNNIENKLNRKFSKNANPYLPKLYKVLEFYRETHDTFTITVNMKIKHAPGQFVEVSVTGFGEAPISICSYSKNFIKLNIREVGNVTNALARLKKGDTILIRGPYGKGYPLETLKGKNLYIIGGGCGVAPLKGIIEYAEQNRKHYKNISLFFGYCSYDDIIFKRELIGWGKKQDVPLALDKKQQRGHMCYDATQGFITDTLKHTEFSKKDNVAFLCGPPMMIKSVIELLKEKGFSDKEIYISAERLMYCAIGICCHCMIRGKYTCLDGPVFRYDKIKDLKND